MVTQVIVLVALGSVTVFVARVLILTYLDLRRSRLWKSLPTVDQYLRTSNPAKGNGISCIKCGSRQLRERKVYGTRRVIKQCRHCDTDLFRAEHKLI